MSPKHDTTTTKPTLINFSDLHIRIGGLEILPFTDEHEITSDVIARDLRVSPDILHPSADQAPPSNTPKLEGDEE